MHWRVSGVGRLVGVHRFRPPKSLDAKQEDRPLLQRSTKAQALALVTPRLMPSGFRLQGLMKEKGEMIPKCVSESCPGMALQDDFGANSGEARSARAWCPQYKGCPVCPFHPSLPGSQRKFSGEEAPRFRPPDAWAALSKSPTPLVQHTGEGGGAKRRSSASPASCRKSHAWAHWALGVQDFAGLKGGVNLHHSPKKSEAFEQQRNSTLGWISLSRNSVTIERSRVLVRSSLRLT